MPHLLILVLALLVDRRIGDPPGLWSRLPHPVVWFGGAISLFDRGLNRATLPGSVRKRNGVIAIALLLLATLAAGAVLDQLFRRLGVVGDVAEVLLVSVMLAQKSLHDHVKAVGDGLRNGGLDGGRRAVSLIVGRDPQALDEAGVSRAAIESLAENFADGVVAPALWYALLGLPGILAYKMLNTADSMIGHKNDTYLDFGWAAARLDDLANWPAARLSALIVAVAAWSRDGRPAALRTLAVASRDSGLHRSPNSGWPEAAFAGALDLQLTGPRIYGGVRVSEPMINGSGKVADGACAIERALSLYLRTLTVSLALALAALGVQLVC